MEYQRPQQRREVLYRRYDYEEETVFVADLGVGDDEATVDVVDGTAVLVVETDEGPEQYEFDLPAGDARTFIKNGVVTVEVEGQ